MAEKKNGIKIYSGTPKIRKKAPPFAPNAAFFITLLRPRKTGDGIIEGLEWKNKTGKNFLLGVQWHPERLGNMQPGNPLGKNIRETFLNAVRNKL